MLSWGLNIFQFMTGSRRAKARNAQGRGVVMQSIYLILFVSLGGFIFSAAYWWTTTAYGIVAGTSEDTAQIGKVAFLGSGESRDAEAALLPRLIAAHLDQKRAEINAAFGSLKAARDRQAAIGAERNASNSPRIEVVDEFIKQGDIPLPFSGEEIDISLKFGDVDVGSLLSWFKAQTDRTPKLELTVSERADGQSTVYGHLAGKKGYSFMLELTDKSYDVIADAVAFSIIKEQTARRDGFLASIPADDYRAAIEALTDYAKFLDSKDLIFNDRSADYRLHQAKISRMADKYGRWRDLQWLAVDVSVGAEAWPDACRYLTVLDAETDTAHGEKTLIQRKLSEFSESCEPPQAAIVVAAASGQESTPDPWATIRSAINLPEDLTGNGIRIGIVGPSSTLGGVAQAEILQQSRAKADIQAYANGVVDSVRRIAPKATIVASGGVSDGAVSLADIVRAFDTLTQKGEVDIILSGFGSPVRSAVYDEAIRLAQEAGIVVVLPAGNSKGETGFSHVKDLALVAGAIGEDGAPASFTATGEGLVFAPGSKLLVNEAKGELSLKSGTTYSAAIVAAAAALLLEESGRGRASDIVDALKSTSAATAPDLPPVINVEAARAALLQ